MAGHDAFDPAPVTELAPDEPRTPLWLPAVGLTLFLLGGAWWALGGDDAPASDAPAAGSAAPAPEAAPPAGQPAPAAAPPAGQPAARRDAPRIPPRDGQAVPNLPTDPKAIEEMRRRIEERRRTRAAQPGEAAP